MQKGWLQLKSCFGCTDSVCAKSPARVWPWRGPGECLNSQPRVRTEERGMKVSQARVSESISTKGEEGGRRFDIRLVLCHQQGCNPPGNMGIVESII